MSNKNKKYNIQPFTGTFYYQTVRYMHFIYFIQDKMYLSLMGKYICFS